MTPTRRALKISTESLSGLSAHKIKYQIDVLSNHPHGLICMQRLYILRKLTAKGLLPGLDLCHHMC